MLNKDTLQLIIDNAVTAAAKTLETSAHELVVIPDSMHLQSLEQYGVGRARFRGTLHTHSLSDFANYVLRHADNSTLPSGFIDQDNMACTVLFNLGTPGNPGHGDDTATLRLQATAAYRALLGILQKPLQQQDLAEWLEDWAQHWTAQCGSEQLSTAQAITGIRKMTIKASSQRDSVVGDMSASRSAMDQIEAASLDRLPTSFIFTCQPYEGLPSVTVELRLSVITSKETPLLKLRWVGEEAQREAIAHTFKSCLTKEIGGALPLTLGTYSQNK